MVIKSKALISLSAMVMVCCQAFSETSMALTRSAFRTSASTGTDKAVYRLGVPPMHSTRRLWSRYQPIVEQINATVTDFGLELESAQSELVYEQKCRERVLDVVLVEAHRVLDAEKLGYSVIAQTGTQDRIAGLIAVRRDSRIRQVSDLRNRTVDFSSPHALASTMMVRMWLREASFPVDRTAHVVYVGSQEGALWNVLLRRSDAAGVSKDGWASFIAQYPFAREQMEARWMTDELPGAALMAQDRVSSLHRRQIAEAFRRLSSNARGKSALEQAGISEFRRGDTVTYDPVWEFMGQYQRAFGRVPSDKKILP